MSEPELREITLKDALLNMNQEDFMNFVICGFNYITSDEINLKMLKKGSVLKLNGNLFKLNTNVDDIVKLFDDVEINELIAIMINEMAMIGMTLTFLSLGEKDILTKSDKNGKQLSKTQMKKEIEKERKILKNSAYVFKKILEKNAERMGLDLTK